MFLRRFRSPFLSIAGTGALIALLALLLHRQQKEPPFGRYNTSQVIERTQRLCRLVAPQTPGLHLSAFQHQPHAADLTRYWTVDCDDEDGNPVVWFSWNADSGELNAISRVQPLHLKQQAPLLTQWEAVGITRRWLRDLEIAPPGSGWRLGPLREHVQGGSFWHVSWRAQDRVAHIRIDSRSGDLIQAMSWRISPHSEPP